MSRGRSASLASWTFAVVWVVPGCSTPVGVDRVGWEATYREVTVDAVEEGTASEASRVILDRHGLLDRFDDEPEAALRELHSIACRERTTDHLFALSELSYLEARRTSGRERYLASAAYAYLFLFDAEFAGERDPFDPRFRLAADLYNSALTEALRDERGDVSLSAGVRELPFGTLDISLDPTGYPRLAEVERFVPAADYRLRGLRVRNRHRGLGIALTAIGPLPPDQVTPIEDRATTKSFRPASAFLRLSGLPGDEEAWKLSGSLEVRDPRVTRRVEVGEERVPLEADLSAPVAQSLEGSKLWSFGLSGLLSGSVKGFKPGLYMVQPYAPGKIPVVLVHGTASSPARWADMLNSLGVFPETRDKFQVWYFIYTTGNPIGYSASFLRDELGRVVRELDPEGRDPALKQIVLVGHSQGGLLARMSVSDTGTVLWDEIIKSGVDLDRLSPEDREVLRKMAIFERVPDVSRVVFVATPHGGSYQAGRWYAGIGSALISVPSSLFTLGKDALGADRTISEELGSRMPTSIENMSPRSRFVAWLRLVPIHPDVKVHSIVAVRGSGPPEKGNDGVVEYVAAHLEGVGSERVVRSGHSCQSHPGTVMELRRILLEHASEIEKASAAGSAKAP